MPCRRVAKSTSCQADELPSGRVAKWTSWLVAKLMSCQVDELPSGWVAKRTSCQADKLPSGRVARSISYQVDELPSWWAAKSTTVSPTSPSPNFARCENLEAKSNQHITYCTSLFNHGSTSQLEFLSVRINQDLWQSVIHPCRLSDMIILIRTLICDCIKKITAQLLRWMMSAWCNASMAWLK